MTAVTPVMLPGSRTLASWWKQLAPFHPLALWTGQLLLHRVEALAALQLLSPLDRICLFVLRALSLAEGTSLQDLDQHLHLGLPLLRQLVRRLESERLVQREASETWSLLELGRQALRQGSYPRNCQERRTFYFVESDEASRPPHYLSFAYPPPALPWPGGESWRFDPNQLQACLDRSPEWKQRFGFPPEVHQVLSGETARESTTDASQEWQRIIVDRPERLLATLVLVSAGAEKARLLGFAVQPEGWTLRLAEPTFALQTDWQDVFPELAADLALEQWRHAWRAWCQPRGLPAVEVDACILERHGYRLRVMAVPRLVERLRAARSDVFKGEAWLLAGTGRLRAAGQIELVERR